MANYFLVVLDQSRHQWLLGLLEDQFDMWEELRQAFIDNFIATYEQPGNKYDLKRIRDRKDEPLYDYIRHFLDMRLKILKISHNKASPLSSRAFVTMRLLGASYFGRGRPRSPSFSPLPRTTPMLTMPRS